MTSAVGAENTVKAMRVRKRSAGTIQAGAVCINLAIPHPLDLYMLRAVIPVTNLLWCDVFRMRVRNVNGASFMLLFKGTRTDATLLEARGGNEGAQLLERCV